MTTTKPIEVHLDRVRKIRYSNRAQYRMATLDRPFSLRDLTNRKFSIGALVAWIWASLEGEDAEALSTPEAVAEILPIADQTRLGEVSQAFLDSVTDYDTVYAPKKGGAAKKRPSKSSSKT